MHARTPQVSSVAGWVFTDDRGMKVRLPTAPSRAVAEIDAASALWDYGVRPVDVFGPQRRADGEIDARVGNVDLASVVNLGEVWGEVDIEGLLALNADLVVGPTWDPPEIFCLTLGGEAALGDRVPAAQADQVDVWHAEPIASHARYAPELRRLADVIRHARSDVA